MTAPGARTTIVIPPQSGGVVAVSQGEGLRITDVDGCQVSDFFAVSQVDQSEYLSARITRMVNWRLFPEVGQPFLTSVFRPMFLFERDDSPGIHDMLAAPCSTEMYARMGWEGYHPSCSDNFREAAGSVGWRPEEVPDPVDFFQNTPVGDDGRIASLPAPTSAGDSVTLRALMDVFAIVTACSMDLKDINGDTCTSIRVDVLPATDSG